MAPANVGLLGFVAAFALAALLYIARHYRSQLAGGSWVEPWCASTGSGSNGSAPKLRPRPLTLAHIAARRSTIVRWLGRFGVADSDQHNLAQLVITEAWRCRETYRPESAALDTWLHAITRNLALTHLQSAWVRRVRLRHPDEDDQTFVTEETPEDALERARQVHRASVIVERLDPRLSAVFVAYEVEGVPMREIATTLGLYLSTAWGRLERARREVALLVGRAAAREEREAACRRRRP
jgi:RNA polymerase sigma factor (sigma-70 family)